MKKELAKRLYKAMNNPKIANEEGDKLLQLAAEFIANQKKSFEITIKYRR